MPPLNISEEKRRALLASRGLDPTYWTIGEDRRPVLKGTEPPSIEVPEVLPQEEPPSILGSLFRGTGEATLPTLGALGVGKLGAGVGSFFGPVGTAAGGILGALAGGIGTGIAQRKVVPDEIQEAIFLRQEDIEANPFASSVGSFIPITPFFNPIKGIQQLPNVARGARNLLSAEGRAAITPQQLNALVNTGIGIGTEAGSIGAEAIIGDRDIGATEVLTRLGLAGLLNEPSKLGRRFFGFQGSEDFGPIRPEVAGLLEDVKPGVRFRAGEGGIEDLVRGTGLPDRPRLEQARVAGLLPERFPERTRIERPLEEARVEPVVEDEGDIRLTKVQERTLQERDKRLLQEETKTRERVFADKEQIDLTPEQQSPQAIKKAIDDFYSAKVPEDPFADIRGKGDIEKARLASPGNRIGQEKVPKDLVDSLDDRRTTLRQVLENIPINSKYKKLTEYLVEIGDYEGLNVKFTRDRPGFFYDQYTDTINFQEGITPRINDLIHEGLHALVSKKIEIEVIGSGAIIEEYTSEIKLRGKESLESIRKALSNENISPELKTILNSYLKTAAYFDDPSITPRIGDVHDTIRDPDFPYFLSDIHEFISESFSNPRVQKLLRELPSDTPGKSLWKQLVDAIKDLLGLTDPEMRTLLDDVLEAGSALIKRARGDTSYRSKGESIIRSRLPQEKGGELDYAQKEKGKEGSGSLLSSLSDKEQKLHTRLPQDIDPEEVSSVAVEKESKISVKGVLDSIDNFMSRTVGSTIDKVNNLKTPTAKFLADKLERWAARASLYMGTYRNRPLEVILQVDQKSRDRVDQYGRELMSSRGKESKIKLNDKETKVYESLREYLKKVADENEARQIKENPWYWPPVMSRSVHDEWLNRYNSTKGNQYKKEFIKYAASKLEGKDEADKLRKAEKLLEETRRAVTSSESTGIEFGPLRYPAGIGLPESLQDNNLYSRFSRYGSRVAKDRAFYDVIQTDKAALRALDMPNKDGNRIESATLPDGSPVDGDIAFTKEIQDVKKWMYGEGKTGFQAKIDSLARLTNSSLLGPGTGVRNMIQIPVNSIPFIGGLRNIDSYWKAIPRFREALKSSIEFNARQHKTLDQEFNSAGEVNSWADRVNHLANLVRKFQGREFSEQMERAYLFAQGEVVALAEVGRALRGDKSALKWVEKFSKSFDKQEEIFSKKSIQDIDMSTINKMAKEFVDASAGSYDIRGLPLGSIEGNLSPFFALSRWSIERTNRVYKDVITPLLREGDYMPFLSYTLGAVFTGAIIKEVSNLLNNSESSTPDIGEVLAVDDPRALDMARSFVNLMQLSAYIGIVSDVTKIITDTATGHKPTGGPIGFPLVDFMAETLGKGVADYASALDAGEDKFSTTYAFVMHTLLRSVQGLRLIANNTTLPGLKEIASADLQERRKLFRDIRIFRELEGELVSSDILQSNPFIDRDIKEFKRTEDLGRAVELLPQVLGKSISKAQGDPEDIEKNLRGLKQIATTDFPNPDNNPQEFARYLDFLTQTKGEEEASKRLTDYLRRRRTNEIKRSIVP